MNDFVLGAIVGNLSSIIAQAMLLIAVAVFFRFGSSAGSRAKDAVIAGQLGVTPQSPAQGLPVPALPIPLPAPSSDAALSKSPPGASLEPPAAAVPPGDHPLYAIEKFSGQVSDFGGPDDTGVKSTEGLSLVERSEMHKFPGIFLSEQPPGTTGLARMLNPDALYCAMRWDWSKTPRTFLQSIMLRVINAAGDAIMVRPVDYGPGIMSRIIDLSPGAFKRLGLKTGDTVTIEVPLPSPIAAAAGAAPPTGVHIHAMGQTQADLERVFGKFTYTEGSGGDINIDQAWITANIVEVDIPQLHKFTKNRPIQCHRIIAPHLAAAFADVEAKGLLGLVLAYDGLWVPRHKDHNPARGISLHSWGAAIDINADWNPYGGKPAPLGAKGSTVALIPSFEAQGFAWGGYFTPPSTDAMHFEYARTS